MEQSIASGRLVALDVLRCVSILLVLGRHLPTCPSQTSVLLYGFSGVWRRGGWVGVDLFFVLSGFLVSGLLFQEYGSTGAIHWSRFFIRRGLKIYPAFGCFTCIGLAYEYACGRVPEISHVLAEVTFTQSYFPHVWRHTWSLAVEEHFYLLLPPVLMLLLGLSKLAPIRCVASFVLGVSALCLFLRVYRANLPFDYMRDCFATHKRIDSLFAGALFSATYYYYRKSFLKWKPCLRLFFVAAGLLCLLPAFVFPLETTPWLHTWGYTLFYLGGVLLTAAAVSGTDLKHTSWRMCGRVGFYSYSIYLWHDCVLSICARLFTWAPWPLFAITYICAALAVGYGMAKLIEVPILRVRDHLFPSPTQAIREEVDLAENSKPMSSVLAR